MKRQSVLKKITKPFAIALPAIILSGFTPIATVITVSSAQAETSKYRFSEQYQKKREAYLNRDRVSGEVTENAKLNKLNRNGKSKNRFSIRANQGNTNSEANNLADISIDFSTKHRNGKSSKYRFINKSI